MKNVLVYGISGSFGGVEAVVHSVISNADQSKIHFDILTFYDKIEYQDEYEAMGVHIHTVTSRRTSFIKNKMEMKEFFKKNGKEYDVIWCNLAELINIDALKLAKKYGIQKRIIHSHSMGSTRNPLLTKLHYAHKKHIDKIATDFWACSELAGAWFFNESIMMSDRFQVIRNAIDTKKFVFDQTTRQAVRDEFSLQEAFTVGHVGRFSIGEKNTLFLLEIFQKIVDMRPQSKLLLVGDGGDREAVENRIQELGLEKKVVLTGYRADVEKIMCGMDVFLLPSRMEGFGIVLIEAQGCGLPTYTSANVVPREVAVTPLLHFLELEKSPEEWAKEIISTSKVERYSRTEALEAAGFEIELESKRVQDLLIK